MEYITCWTALDYVDESNGCLWVIPGSHNEAIAPHEFRKSNERDYGGVFLVSMPIRTNEAIPICLEPGDILCLHSRLIHETRSNFSPTKRRGLVSAYMSSHAAQGHSFAEDEKPVTLLRNNRKISS